ncbi:MAG TPA: hypothetical protein ENK99_02260, partial [Campylobacterales bacterium]|nr:hypothetical protein [Campylobacterales bacterium]
MILTAPFFILSAESITFLRSITYLIPNPSQLGHDAVINPFAEIGRGAIINTGTTVHHDCTVADGVHISPGHHLGGAVQVGRATW